MRYIELNKAQALDGAETVMSSHPHSFDSHGLNIDGQTQHSLN